MQCWSHAGKWFRSIGWVSWVMAPVNESGDVETAAMVASILGIWLLELANCPMVLSVCCLFLFRLRSFDFMLNSGAFGSG